MKHKPKITIILIAMFIVTQFIGLYVVNHYQAEDNKIPYGMQTPELKESSEYYTIFPSLILAFVIAIVLLFLLMKFKVEFFLKLWFFVVVAIALGLSFNVLLSKLQYAALIAIVIAIPLAFIKIYKQSFLIHNFTELLIYPGIAAVFVPILNIWTIIALLVLISLYDMWAVWHSGFMQKMAKYQMTKLKVFSGFFVPYMSKTMREKIKKMKKTMKKSELAKKRIKVNVALLGGGDVIFPIITAGVMLKVVGWTPALFVVAGATIGLSYLLLKSEKKKFYPAMPFITAGIFLALAIWRIFVY